jgi:hypothetical protein
MDPNTTLEEARRFVAEARAATEEGAKVQAMAQAIERFEALDNWLYRGGFLPAEWTFAVER